MYPEKRLSRVFLPRAAMNSAVKLAKSLFARIQVQEDKLTYWQLIVSQGEANGRLHYHDDLPYYVWVWPKNTWFQERLSRHLRVREIPPLVHEELGTLVARTKKHREVRTLGQTAMFRPRSSKTQSGSPRAPERIASISLRFNSMRH